jgi:L-ascorbate metabolism protein UlaG (beta-lactamase superfamily)
VLVRLAGMNVLIDPVFAHRIGLSLGSVTIGLQRHRPAPVRAEDLPPLDLILISHAHFDHLDKPTLRRLANPKTTVITARQTRDLIPEGFAHVLELDWDRTLHFRGLNIEAIRPAHWGARTAIDRRRGYNSYILRDNSPSRHGRGVLLAGDTAYTDAFTRVTDLALAVMGIGSYDPWTHAHATPEETWEMFTHTGAPKLLPVHHSTFPLGDEAIEEPMTRLMARARDQVNKVIGADQGQVWAG